MKMFETIKDHNGYHFLCDIGIDAVDELHFMNHFAYYTHEHRTIRMATYEERRQLMKEYRTQRSLIKTKNK